MTQAEDAARTPAVTAIDPLRHPAAVAGAITAAWQPYRRRAYAGGFVLGVVIAGVVAPIVTSAIELAVLLAAGVPIPGAWSPLAWTLAFAIGFPLSAAALFMHWQPSKLRAAAQSYVWLAQRAEDRWHETVGPQAVPRDEDAIRTMLATMAPAETTAVNRYGLAMALLDLETARAAAAHIPTATSFGRFSRAAADWLIAFVSGTTLTFDAMEAERNHVDDEKLRTEADVLIAVCQARVAVAEGLDWQAPLADVRRRLGTEPDRPYRALIWSPTVRTLLRPTLFALALYGIAAWVLRVYFGVGLVPTD